MLITDIMKAWDAGQIIANPEKWKAGIELTNYLSAIFTGVIALLKWKYPDLIISEESKDAILQVVGGGLVFANVVVNRITTLKRISLSGTK